MLSVRKNGQVVMIADGQMTRGSVVVKSSTKKVHVLSGGKVLVGMAGMLWLACVMFVDYLVVCCFICIHLALVCTSALDVIGICCGLVVMFRFICGVW